MMEGGRKKNDREKDADPIDTKQELGSRIPSRKRNSQGERNGRKRKKKK